MATNRLQLWLTDLPALFNYNPCPCTIAFVQPDLYAEVHVITFDIIEVGPTLWPIFLYIVKPRIPKQNWRLASL